MSLYNTPIISKYHVILENCIIEFLKLDFSHSYLIINPIS
nr:MAG TPA: hypothetical protein [Caudoviricetes sp.]